MLLFWPCSLRNANTERERHTLDLHTLYHTQTAGAGDAPEATPAAVVQKRNIDTNDSEPAAASIVLLQREHPDDALLSGSATAVPPPPLLPSSTDDGDRGGVLDETSATYWRILAQATLQQQLQVRPNTNRAKNVIFFLGDGMSLPTIVAARMYAGQQQGHSGEEGRLSFEQFPYVGLSKVSVIRVLLYGVVLCLFGFN